MAIVDNRPPSDGGGKVWGLFKLPFRNTGGNGGTTHTTTSSSSYQIEGSNAHNSNNHHSSSSVSSVARSLLPTRRRLRLDPRNKLYFPRDHSLLVTLARRISTQSSHRWNHIMPLTFVLICAYTAECFVTTPSSITIALHDSNWNQALIDGMHALLKNVSSRWVLQELDVQNAFLYSFIDEDVYMEQPPVLLIRSSLHVNVSIYALVYVNDIIVTGFSSSNINNLINMLAIEFPVKSLGDQYYSSGLPPVSFKKQLTIARSTSEAELKALALTTYEPGKQVQSAIKIKNTSKSHVAFKFQTTAPKSCFMRPPGAILAPGESIIATVFKFVEPLDSNEKQVDQKRKVKFKIMSLKVKGMMDYVPELFDEQKDQVAVEQILQVVFLDIERPSPALEKLKHRLAEAEAALESHKKPAEDAGPKIINEGLVIDEWKEERDIWLDSKLKVSTQYDNKRDSECKEKGAGRVEKGDGAWAGEVRGVNEQSSSFVKDLMGSGLAQA
ncbi:hypothetical protein OSB04_002508 [Centaurea solstitialis]|uniref:MSP domain-containing protein n=1 Tax=Centaurea solstitialis TaxID=347529 RepID=A0AA38WMV5_9ASTR|nr:hypothetical protein OSB04_002508 [Centaurea solstitialis]